MQDPTGTDNMIVVMNQTVVIKKTKQTERIKPRPDVSGRGFSFMQYNIYNSIAG